MAKKKTDMSGVTELYGTPINFKPVKSNRPVRSRYLAAVLAIILGMLGAHHFYLRNVLRGIIELLFTAIVVVFIILFNMPFLILIPEAIAAVQGVIYLSRSDSSFAAFNHVRTV